MLMRMTYVKKGYASRAHKCEPDHFLTCKECGGQFHRNPQWRACPRTFCSNPCRLTALNRDQVRFKVSNGDRSSINQKGYVRVYVWRDGKKTTTVEHRWVMSQVIGRDLRPEERVHHINGDRSDNRPENLKLYPNQAAHLRAEHPYLVHNLPGR